MANPSLAIAVAQDVTETFAGRDALHESFAGDLQFRDELDARGREELDAIHATGKQGGVMTRDGAGVHDATGGGVAGAARIGTVHPRMQGLHAGRNIIFIGIGRKWWIGGSCRFLKFKISYARFEIRGNSGIHRRDAERGFDFRVDEFLERATIHATGHFAQNPAVSDGVIDAFLSGGSDGLQLRDEAAHGVPIANFLGANTGGHKGNSGSVRQGVTEGDCFLAFLRELGPVMRDRCVVIDLAAFGQDVYDRRLDSLGCGEDGEEGVGVNDGTRADIGDARLGIDDEFAVNVNGDLSAALFSLGDKGIENGLDGVLEISLHGLFVIPSLSRDQIRFEKNLKCGGGGRQTSFVFPVSQLLPPEADPSTSSG
jgi:hypothetical protein